jgi:hypothetical protein
MTYYSGFVQTVKILDSTAAFVSVGDTAEDAILLSVAALTGDSTAVLAGKRALLGLLSKACVYGFAVEVVTVLDTYAISSVGTAPLEIAPNDQPVHEDFFAVTGQDFPDDAQLVFDSSTATVVVTPDLVRPHLLLVSSLSAAVPLGWNTLWVTSSAGDTEPFPVEVTDEPQYLKRVFTSGAPKEAPFTLAIVANGAIDRDGTLNLYADPVLGDRAGYHAITAYAMSNIFATGEDFLRPNDRDAEMRIVSVFDVSLAVDAANALCEEDPESTTMTAVKERVNWFLAHYQEVTDLCIAFHGSTTNTRGSANRCLDDYTRGTATAFTMDGVGYLHWPFRDEPGTTAISVTNSTTRMTAIHELGHAASEQNNGCVRDLYTDDAYSQLTVNKRWRAAATDPVPATFSDYDGHVYDSDPTRGPLGYPADWVSYHCELREPAAPNLMDSYTPSSELDRVTHAWYRDRIRVILNR